MKEEEIEIIFQRLDQLKIDSIPLFGKMNAHQMVCHCTDQIRLALGTFMAEEYGRLEPKEVIALSKAGKTVPAAKGLGQVEGGGTKPINFSTDVKLLKQHILDFSMLNENFEFGLHPYFGHMTKEKWIRLTLYHLNHHFNQFGL
jgi:hypothetical protein